MLRHPTFTRCLTYDARRYSIAARTGAQATKKQLAKGESSTPAPSLLWKAYAEALRPFLTSETHLGDRGMAMYISSPFTYGIAGGQTVPLEIRNQHIATHCDRALDLDSPLLDSSTGYRSYFNAQLDLLGQAMTTQPDKTSTPQLNAARAKLQRFKSLHESDPNVSFTEWMKQFATEYSTAWTNLQAQLQLYKSLLDASNGPLGNAMEMMLSANSKLEYRAGNNMPCAAEDLGPMQASRSPEVRATLSPGNKGVYYRSLYFLSEYDRCVDGWMSTFDMNAQPSYRIPLDVVGAASLPWARLGFPHLDGASEAYQRFDRNMKPLEDDHIRPSGFHQLLDKESIPSSASISLYGVQAFDVERGFWNVDINPYAVHDVEIDTHTTKPLMKITRILCSYKVKIKASFDSMPHDGQDRPTVFGASPLASPGGDPMLGYDTRNDAVIVPQLLAVLAKKF